AARALGELPLVVPQVVEEVVRPLHGRVGPGALQAARDRVGALARPVLVLPAEALLLDRRRLRFAADVLRGGGRAVRLAERVAARDQGHRLLVAHAHAAEGDADVLSGGERVW